MRLAGSIDYPEQAVGDESSLVEVENVSGKASFELKVAHAFICLIQKRDGKIFFVRTKSLESCHLEEVVGRVILSLEPSDSVKYFLVSDRAAAIASSFESIELKDVRRRVESTSREFSVEVCPKEFRLKVKKAKELGPPGQAVFGKALDSSVPVFS